ncbi:hypothetical protein GEMRC1_003336 [Eukaryota sp. GEM-RC1]
MEAATLDDVIKSIHSVGSLVQSAINDDDLPCAEVLRVWSECVRCVDSLFLSSLTRETVLDYFLNSITTPGTSINLCTAFLIVKHLLSTHSDTFDEKRDTLVAMCRGSTNTQSVPVKKALVEMTATLARSGFISINGAQELIDFVVSCAATDPSTPAAKNLVRVSEDVLNLIVTTIEEIHTLLWPQMIEQLKPLTNFSAAPIICKCLTTLYMSLPEDMKGPVSTKEFRDLPKLDWMVAMMFVFLNNCKNSKHVDCVLGWFDCIREVYDLEEKSSEVVAEHVQHLRELDFKNFSNFENHLLIFFVKLLASTSDQFHEDVASKFQAIIGCLTDSELKKSILRFVGALASLSKGKDFVFKTVDWLLSITNFSDERQRSGLAVALGLVSEHHLDPVLDALGSAMTNGVQGQNVAQPQNDLIASLLICFGFVCKHAPVNLLAPRLETYVLPHIKPYLSKPRVSPPIREAALTCTNLLAKAINPSKLAESSSGTVTRFLFKPRDELLNLVVDLTNPAEIPDQYVFTIRFKALAAFSSLILLAPALSSALSSTCLSSILRLTAVQNGSAKERKELQDKLERCISSLLDSNPSLDNLISIAENVFQWLEGTPDTTATALLCLKSALHRFIEIISQEVESDQNKQVDDVDFPIGNLLGPLIPSGFHSLKTVRVQALECIELCLYAHHIFSSSKMTKEKLTPPDSLRKLTQTKMLLSDEVNTAGSNCLGSHTAGLLSSQQVLDMVLVLGRFLVTCQPATASYCASFLSSLIAAKGDKISKEVVGILTSLLSLLGQSGCSEHTAVGDGSVPGALLEPLLLLCEQHQSVALDFLLSSFDTKVEQQVIGKPTAALIRGIIGKSCGPAVLLRVIDSLNSGQQYDAPRGKAIQPAGITCGLSLILNECLSSKFFEQVIKADLEAESDDEDKVSLWTAICCSILLRIGCCKELVAFDAHSYALKSLSLFLSIKCNATFNSHVSNTGTFSHLGSSQSLCHGITNVSFSLVKTKPEMMIQVHRYLSKFFSASYPGQRLVATAVSGEFIRHFSKPSKFMMTLINSILSRTTDEDSDVRLLAIRGLGNVAISGKRQINKYSGTVLNCLLPFHG